MRFQSFVPVESHMGSKAKYLLVLLLIGLAVAAVFIQLRKTTRPSVTTDGGASDTQSPSSPSSISTNITNQPTPCVVSDSPRWLDDCTQPCGGGTRTGIFDVVQEPTNGGTPCPSERDRTKTLPCNTHSCADNVDCTVSEWGAWSDCDKPCDGGIRSRTRSVVTPSLGTGQQCPALVEFDVCNSQPCDVDCQVSPWGDWSDCSKSCGTGYQTRNRMVTQPPAGNGALCPPLEDVQTCNTQPCDVDCQVSPWGDWSSCDRSCGGGLQSRNRTVTTLKSGAGAECPPLSETQSCNTQGCPVDCQVSSWGTWSTCDKSCGGGTQTRSRTVTVQSQNGGATCPALTETQACNTQACPVDCQVSSWGTWSTCDKSCGGGTQTRSRTVTVQSQNGGATCPALTETQACNTQACPVDCQVSSWGTWSTCDKSCGGGTQTRSRSVTVQPQNGGATCPSLMEAQACNTQACPVAAFAMAGPYNKQAPDKTKQYATDYNKLSNVQQALTKCIDDPKCQSLSNFGWGNATTTDYRYNSTGTLLPFSWPYALSSYVKVDPSDPRCQTVGCYPPAI